MTTNKYKYVVSIGTDIHALYPDRDWEESLRSTWEEVEFLDENLLEARKKALERAEYFANFFAEQPHKIPTRKWNTIEDSDKDLFMLYQIQVFLKGENENEDLCIYDDGDGISGNVEEANMKVFKGLLKEYEIFEKLGISKSEYEEFVIVKDWERFEDWENTGKTEVKILVNGTDWNNPHFTKKFTLESMKPLFDDEPEVKKMNMDEFKLYLENKNDDTIKTETNKISLKNKTNKKIDYKTTSIHRIKIKLDNIEISVKTTSEIPKEIQNELIALIDKWKNL